MLVLLVLAGCKKVPEAPPEYSEMCVDLFAHQWDEDQAVLMALLDRMATWLDEEWDVEEQSDGFTIEALTNSTMDALDHEDRTVRGMVGLSLPTESRHPVIESTWALVAVDQDEVFPDTFSDYHRTYLSGPDCFLDGSCDRMEALEEMTSDFGIAGKSVSYSHNQYVWVDTDRGEAMVHRNWQIDPPEVSGLLPEVDEQAYLNLFIPRGKAGKRAWRIQAQWTVYDPDANIPEESAKRLVVNFFAGSHEDLEEYLDSHSMP